MRAGRNIAGYGARLLLALLLGAAAPAWALTTTSAIKDLTCAGDRYTGGGSMNCTAKEFTVSPVFSAADGTAPFCTVGAEFNFLVDLELTGTNTDRYDIGFFVGQTFNNPIVAGSGQCSVATFPTTPAPWEDDDGNTCGDFNGNGTDSVRINEIKVVCQPDTAGVLAIPYALTYRQSTGGTCTGPSNVIGTSASKCNAGQASVAGVISVGAGAYLDVTKQTLPDGHAQSFSFTATGPVGSKVIALSGATLSVDDASGGTYSSTYTAATNSVTFNLTDGQTVRVYINALAAAQTLSVAETSVAGWDTTASISCSQVTGTPTLNTNNATRTMSAALSATASAAACTITNTKLPTLQLTKVSNGDVGTWTFTGTNGWSSQNITTATSGVGVTGTRQTLTAASTATTITESAVAGFRVSGISCSSLGAGGTATPNLTARTVALDAAATSPGSDISCTYTNQRQRTLTATKSLSPLADAGLFVMNANGTTGVEAGDGATANALVDVGATATASEAAGTGTALANYTSTYSCNTAPVTSGNGSTVNFTMPNANVACGFTNTRKSASLTLTKTWQNAIATNAATVSSSGFTNNATTGVSTSTGNNSTTGSGVTVYAGESGTLDESFSSGSAVNYNATLGCTGTSGLAGTAPGSTLTVDPADTAIACTMTNARKSAQLTLQKTWSAGRLGDEATVSSSGFTNNASTGASVSSGNNTTASAAVTVYAAESGTIAEVLGVGDPAEYLASLSCTGSSGLSGATLTVDPADTAITCTYTNTLKQPSLTLLKSQTVISDPINGVTNPKSIPGTVRSYTIRVTNSGPGAVDNNSLVIRDPLPAGIELYVGDLAGPGLGPVAFVDGATASGLSWTYTALASLLDNVDFSNDGGATWNYVPVPDVDGFDAAVTHVRLKPSGAMSAAGVGNPYADFTFRVRVK